MAIRRFERDSVMRWVMMVCLFMAVGMTLAACKPSNYPPPSGKVSLEFVAMSGSDAEFRLGNGTSRTIGLIGARSLVAGFDFWITCNNMLLNTLPSEQGWGERATVPPGESIRVVFRGEFEKGGRCHVRLRLQDGSDIDSSEFQP